MLGNGLLRRFSPDAQPVTAGPLSYFSPVPALSGSRLFVIGEQQRAQLQHFDSRAQQFVPFFEGISGGEIDFSHDGKWAAYISYPDALLWRSRIDGSDKLQLTSAPFSAALPRWSPDGRYISFFTANTKKEKLLEVSTGKWSDLATGNVLVYPNWSPDSKYAQFEDMGPDGPEIDRVTIATHKKERVALLRGVARVSTPDSGATAWNGIAPDGSPLIMRDVGSREVYSLELQLP